MKNFFVLLLCLTSTVSVFSQDNYFKFNGTSDVLLRYLSRGSGGRAIAHDIGNILSLNHGNDFTGGMRLWGEVRIQNKLTVAQMYLQPTSDNDGCYTTNLEYRGHSLRIGSPQGYSTHNNVEIVPGTHASALRNTSLSLYISNNLTDYVKKVQIHSAGNTFFNGGNVGIGIGNPQYKLDVLGSFRLTVPKSNDPISGLDIAVQSFVTSENAQKSYYLKMRDIGAGENTPDVFIVKGNRNVGIGTSNPKNRLDVRGKIRAEEIIVETGWADFVFDKDYKLPSLEEVESHIKEHKRLSDIPSESQVKEEGVGLGEMQVKLLQKIEELTLYVIEQNKKIELQSQRIEELEKSNKQ